MNKYPKGFDGRQTTKEEWDRYRADMKRHEITYRRSMPKASQFKSTGEFDKAYFHWMTEKSLNEPNKPGYYRANND